MLQINVLIKFSSHFFSPLILVSYHPSPSLQVLGREPKRGGFATNLSLNYWVHELDKATRGLIEDASGFELL